MKYTRKQYEAFYYLNKLLPYLNTFEDCAWKFNRINLIKDRGLLVSISKEKNEDKTSKNLYSQIVNALGKYGPVYTKLIPSAQDNNISYLVRILHLNQKEEMVVRFLSAARNNDVLRECLNLFNRDIIEKEDVLTMLAGLPSGAGPTLLRDSAPLKRLGIVEEVRLNTGCRLTGWAREFINTCHKDDEARYKALIGAPLDYKDEFSGQDFSYVEAANLALRLMKRAKHTKGFNILLYGAPGTGKTSFAKVLAKAANLDLYPVGVCNGGEYGENYRLQQFYRKQFLLKNIKNTCLLFDEGEDMFSSLETRTNKMEINNLLENNDIPVIWTTNKIHRMDPAYIRRFTLAVCFNKPPVEVRQKIWHKYLKENKIACSQNDTLTLAKQYEVPPSMIAGAAQVAHMAKGDLNTVQEHLSFMTQALNGGYKKPVASNRVENFSPSLIHADMDLNALTEQLKRLGRLNFSLCLYGASGTGKSAYARYLAEGLNLKVMQRRASDLISPYVGETEQKIARAFAEAKETKVMLVFDEADSFLRDRSAAMRSWEISSVNEMLTWMESHPYPFICTTNLMESLDPACLRRFSFKVKYDFLTLKQVCSAFRYFFRVMIAEAEVAELTKLTPGDFMLVKNKAEILGKEHNLQALRQMLLDEQRLKQNKTGNGIGFRVN